MSYWMKAMTQTLPVATHLHRINRTKHSPSCTHCSQDASLSLLQHLSEIPPCQNSSHTQICKILATSLRKHLAAHWSLFNKTPLRCTGLVLELVPREEVCSSFITTTVWEESQVTPPGSHRCLYLSPQMWCSSQAGTSLTQKLQQQK